MAGYLGVDADRIVTGCGSDDVLDSAMRALAEPGDRLAYLDPTFSMIPVFARLNRLVPVAVATGRFDADADALLATGARIIYLCSPNNPTGGTLPRAVVDRIVSDAPGFVILDEAYAEYAREDCVELARTSSRLLVTRTMSKAFGLAGLRVGYAVGAPDVVRAVAESRGPYKVNAVAERAAAAALTEDLPWVREHVTEVQRLRERFADALRGLGLAPLPSAANFVLVPTPRAAALAGRLRAAGVTVRSFEALPGIGDALRITIGPWPMLERCIGALSEVER
jgi:histidinol-phosphate aminotransferase